MTVALTMMVRDEEQIIGRAIDSARSLVDTIHVLDTGSTDDTVAIAESFGAHVVHAPWEGFGPGRTAALALARDAGWTLMLDADQTVVAHDGLRDWLLADTDPTTDVWTVDTVEAGTRWRMPRITRGGIDWTYLGPTHEWLDTDRKQRPLVGLTIRHHADGTSRTAKHERDIELLAAGAAAGDPRSVYYTAQALDCLGRTDEAAGMYDRRATMVDTWEEERWHAQYMAARLRGDVEELLAAHRSRPWRHEPLTWAARIIAARGNDDVLFCEDGGHV